MQLIEIIYGLSGLVLGLIVSKFVPRYFEKKAENLATKEDIKEITQKIETVKHEYAKQLEYSRALLSADIKNHGYRYEKEFEILVVLSDYLVDVRICALQLRPVIDLVATDKSKDEIKRERLKKFYEARNRLYIHREKCRPFYPDEIYQAIYEVDKVAYSEMVDYEMNDPFEGGFKEYWETAEKNQEVIASKAESALEAIRNRIQNWDSIQRSL